jgi:hypothetical protein
MKPYAIHRKVFLRPCVNSASIRLKIVTTMQLLLEELGQMCEKIYGYRKLLYDLT